MREIAGKVTCAAQGFAKKKALAKPAGVTLRSICCCGVSGVCKILLGAVTGTGVFTGSVNSPHRQVFFVYGSPNSHGWKSMYGAPSQFDSRPTGFSKHHHAGCVRQITLKQASTTDSASTNADLPLFAHHLAPLVQRWVQGGAANTPCTFSGGMYNRTSCSGRVMTRTSYPALW